MTTQPTDKRLAYSQMVYKTTEEVAHLRQAQEAAHNTITASQAELDQLAARQADRNQHLASLRQSFTNMETELTQARNFAIRAKGTPEERPANTKARELDKALKKHQETLHTAETAAATEEFKDTAHRAAFERLIEQSQAELGQTAHQLADAENVLKEAFARLGEEERRDVLTKIEQFRQRIHECEQALLDAQLGLETFLDDEAIPRLTDWSAYLTEVRKERPRREDHLTHALEGQKRMLEALLAGSGTVQGIIKLPAIFHLAGDPAVLLNIPLPEIQAWQHGDVKPLQFRLAIVTQFLAEYQEKLQMEG